MHCHIDWHFVLGLAMLFVEAEDVLRDEGLGAFSQHLRATKLIRWGMLAYTQQRARKRIRSLLTKLCFTLDKDHSHADRHVPVDVTVHHPDTRVVRLEPSTTYPTFTHRPFSSMSQAGTVYTSRSMGPFRFNGGSLLLYTSSAETWPLPTTHATWECKWNGCCSITSFINTTSMCLPYSIARRWH
ncbi:Cupredoxin [Phytophthora cactorum]|nr:Cupredoxin [Phytophthora cactorum]